MPDVAGVFALPPAFGAADAVVLEVAPLDARRRFLWQFRQAQPTWLDGVSTLGAAQAGFCNHGPHLQPPNTGMASR